MPILITLIYLISGGIVPEQTVKTNLVNAYYRYLRNTGDNIVYYVNGILVLNATRSHDTTTILNAINATNLSNVTKKNCVDWSLQTLNHVHDAKIYIVTDQSPCVFKPLASGRGNTVASIGMGPGIAARYLEESCGPCSPFFGCLRGWNWFILP